jgi:two-component system sensor histidine kinase RpfC
MVRGIGQRLRGRPDPEREQALVRFGVGAVAGVYLVRTALADGVIDTPERATLWCIGVFFAGAVAIFASILAWPGPSPARRLAGILLDVGATTAALTLNGELAAPVFPVYLWITFGNGFRYGWPYLAFSSALGVVGFLFAAEASDFAEKSPHILLGLLVGLIILPLYVAFLLGKLTDALARARAGDEAKSRFLANMSHEIRTPLHGIIGIVDVLLDSPLSPAQRRHALLVHRSAAWLLEILDSVLDFSRLRTGAAAPAAEDFDLPAALEEVVDFHREAAGTRGPAIELRVGAGVPRAVRGDRVRILQVLHNLLRNAVKFTPAGRIVVAVERAGTGPGNPTLRFSVADTGIGIPAEARQRVFEPFSQADESTSRSHGGTGLGLAISRELLRALDGEIELESEPGRGTTVRFTVSLAPADEAALPAPAPAEEGAGGGGAPAWSRRPRILVAEDNAVNRELAGIVLAQLGCDAVFAADGREALEAATTQEFDLVLMDCQMPGMDGYEAARAIRQVRPAERLPIVAVTAYTAREHRDRCQDAGMDDFLGKPFRRGDVLAVLTRWLQPSPPSAAARPAPGPEPPAAVPGAHAARPERAAIHELNNVLTGLLGYADLLHAAVSEDPRLRDYAARIVASCERAGALVEELRQR